MSASGLYLETLSLSALGGMGWWKNGRHGAREPHKEITADIQAGVSGGWPGLVAVGMERHGQV